MRYLDQLPKLPPHAIALQPIESSALQREDRLAGISPAVPSDLFEATGARGVSVRQNQPIIPERWRNPSALLDRLLPLTDTFVKTIDRGAGPETHLIASDGSRFPEMWGRDGNINLVGLLLTRGKFAQAQSVIRTFLRDMNRGKTDGITGGGVVPNRYVEPIWYNSSDASMWLLNAVRAYSDYGGDRGFIAEIAPDLLEIVDRYRSGTFYERNGTRYEIRMDPADHLIVSPPQSTWMDADYGAVSEPPISDPVTPRAGKVVEVNALWYSNLAFLGEIGRHVDGPLKERAAELRTLAAAVKQSFVEKFENPITGALFDVIEGDPQESQAIRPNMLFALARGGDLFSERPDLAQRTLQVARQLLLTEVGLRSRAPLTDPSDPTSADPYYQGRYDDAWSIPVRDEAYHQGTVWPWLTGTYVDAYVAVTKTRGVPDAEIRAAVRRIVDPMVDYLETHGSIPEVFDGDRIDGRRNPGGPQSQAWSISELFRVMVEQRLFETPAGVALHRPQFAGSAQARKQRRPSV